MFNKINSHSHEDGFTLIELLVVILIIGILAAIAIPVFLNQQKAAVNASVKSDVRNTVTNVNLFNTQFMNPTSANNIQATGSATGNLNADTDKKPVIVITDKNTTIAVGFDNGVYGVEGFNSDTEFTYSFDSKTGRYTNNSSGIVNKASIPGYSNPGGGSTPVVPSPEPTKEPTPEPTATTPNAPSTLTASSNNVSYTASETKVEWAAVTCAFGQPEYRLNQGSTVGEYQTELNKTIATTPNTSYSYSVTARCSYNGKTSADSVVKTLTYKTPASEAAPAPASITVDTSGNNYSTAAVKFRLAQIQCSVGTPEYRVTANGVVGQFTTNTSIVGTPVAYGSTVSASVVARCFVSDSEFSSNSVPTSTTHTAIARPAAVFAAMTIRVPLPTADNVTVSWTAPQYYPRDAARYSLQISGGHNVTYNSFNASTTSVTLGVKKTISSNPSNLTLTAYDSANNVIATTTTTSKVLGSNPVNTNGLSG